MLPRESKNGAYGTFLTVEEPERSKVTYDEILEKIGEFGRWQQWQCFGKNKINESINHSKIMFLRILNF